MLVALHLSPSIRPAPRTLSNTSGCCAISPSRLWRSAPARREHPRGNQARNCFKNSAAHRAAQWVTAVCGAMRSRSHATCRVFCRKDRAEREATADPFGNHHNIRFNPCPFMRKQLACATHTALNLVQNQAEYRVRRTDRAALSDIDQAAGEYRLHLARARS